MIVNSPNEIKHTLADVFRTYGDAYRSTHKLTREQGEAMWCIERCRTEALGGHAYECDACGHTQVCYNSCRNRHCPTCGAVAKAEWLLAREAEVLPCEYFHVVFTLDHVLNPLIQFNKTTMYELLFESAAQSLKRCAQTYLGGQPRIVMTLHTWGQDLGLHVHVHCIVTGGGLSRDDARWQASPAGFLMPVLPLSADFRARFCSGLDKANRKGVLQVPGNSPQIDALLETLQSKDWNVYATPAHGGAKSVLDYLGRYVQKTAIGNSRIVSIANGQVAFTYHDNRDAGKQKTMTLSADEFIRRFLQHVLEAGFVRVRYFGLFANAWRKRMIARVRELLGVVGEVAERVYTSVVELLKAVTGVDIALCPACGAGRLSRLAEPELVIKFHSSG